VIDRETREQVAPVTLDYAPAPRKKQPRLIRQTIGILSEAAPLMLIVVPTVAFMVRCLTSSSGVNCCHGTDLNRGKMGAMKTPLELYHLHVGAYPASLKDLVTPPSGAAAERWRGPYVANLDDLKDGWERPFRYRAPGIKNPGRYDLWSAGADGVDGTRDDICNW
jgi:general secretion pathway protein G